MIDLDDLDPNRRPATPRPLDGLSVDELEEYVAALEAEIRRTKSMIDRKRSHRSSADALFKG